MIGSSDTELNILLNCIDPSGNAGSITIPHTVYWTRLTDLATRHRMIPLLHQALSGTGNPNITNEFTSEIKRKHLTNTARNEFLVEQQEKILTSLESEGIKALPFKGSALARAAFNDTSMRQFDDIDLLLAKQDILKAAQTLLSEGYTPHLSMKDRTRKRHIESGWGFSLVSPNADYHVELLSSPVPDLCIMNLPEPLIMSDAPDAVLLLLCIHAWKHRWERLSWTADIVYFIHYHPDLDWDNLITNAKETGTKRILLTTLKLASGFPGVDIPEQVTALFSSDSIIEPLVEEVITNWSVETKTPDSRSSIVHFAFKTRERLSDRLKYLLAILLIPSCGEWELVDLPAPLYFLYFFIRPFRLLLGRKK
ncbi:hypothetical protein BVX97_04215 [bacterium E08(2017)]|nr:hypothetical protein BVX97_04215 [bacterium E08(2017)]